MAVLKTGFIKDIIFDYQTLVLMRLCKILNPIVYYIDDYFIEAFENHFRICKETDIIGYKLMRKLLYQIESSQNKRTKRELVTSDQETEPKRIKTQPSMDLSKAYQSIEIPKKYTTPAILTDTDNFDDTDDFIDTDDATNIIELINAIR